MPRTRLLRPLARTVSPHPRSPISAIVLVVVGRKGDHAQDGHLMHVEILGIFEEGEHRSRQPPLTGS